MPLNKEMHFNLCYSCGVSLLSMAGNFPSKLNDFEFKFTY